MDQPHHLLHPLHRRVEVDGGGEVRGGVIAGDEGDQPDLPIRMLPDQSLDGSRQHVSCCRSHGHEVTQSALDDARGVSNDRCCLPEWHGGERHRIENGVGEAKPDRDTTESVHDAPCLIGVRRLGFRGHRCDKLLGERFRVGKRPFILAVQQRPLRLELVVVPSWNHDVSEVEEGVLREGALLADLYPAAAGGRECIGECRRRRLGRCEDVAHRAVTEIPGWPA